MKGLLILVFSFFLFGNTIHGQQNDTLTYKPDQKYIVTLNDGATHIGYILSVSDKEVHIKTEQLGKIVIPKYVVQSILKYDPVSTNSKKESNLLASRYIQTTNGFPVRKGEGYLKVMPVGLDFQFAITDNWSMGGMTSWIGIPLVFTTKYSHTIVPKLHVSAGLLYANLFYGNSFTGNDRKPFSSGGGILFGNITYGSEWSNINLSAGYGFTHLSREIYEPTNTLDMYGNVIYHTYYEMEYESTALFSIGAVKNISEQVNLVFDSVINFNKYSNVYLFAPAVRYTPKRSNIFQFGLGMAVIDEVFLPIPIPMLSYHKVFLQNQK